VQALIEQGNVDPVAIRGISWPLCYVTPICCPQCGLNYCSGDWDTCVDFSVGLYDWIMGACPAGHRHIAG